MELMGEGNAVSVVGTSFGSLTVSDARGDLEVAFDEVKVLGAASFSKIAHLKTMRMRSSAFGGKLDIDPGAQVGSVELTDITLEQANVLVPKARSLKATRLGVKKQLNIQVQEHVSKRKRRVLAAKSTGKDVDISDVYHDGTPHAKSTLAVDVKPTKDAKDLSVSIANVTNMALKFTVADAVGLSHVSVKDISGSRSHLSAISFKKSSLRSLNISRVGFNLGGSVKVHSSKILEDLALIDMEKMSFLEITDSASARVKINSVATVSGDVVIQRHKLTGPDREFDLDLEDAVIGGNLVVDDISGD
jgi:hypothetical protein